VAGSVVTMGFRKGLNMRWPSISVHGVWFLLAWWVLQPGGTSHGTLRFDAQEIDRSLTVGYAVFLEDVNGDQKLDVVVIDSRRVLWFENPQWTSHILVPEGATEPDNVCGAWVDRDGDGRREFLLGSGWKGLDSRAVGRLRFFRPREKPQLPWVGREMTRVVSLHRVRAGDVNGDGQPEIVVAPLLGEGVTREGNYSEAAVPLLYGHWEKFNGVESWRGSVIDGERLHVLHNIWLDDLNGNGLLEVLTASYEGLWSYEYVPFRGWQRYQIGAGDQTAPDGPRGASEVKTGRLADGRRFVAAVEPFHGHQLVVYWQKEPGRPTYERFVVDDRLREGHGLWCADLDRDGSDEIVLGFRQPVSQEIPYGLHLYRIVDASGGQWRKEPIDEGGVAVEDLAVSDLDGDGWEDIVAVGRATRNVKIYWNRGPRAQTPKR
jgi:hypothetical protein